MQIAQKSSCEVATAAKPDPPGYHYQFKLCQLSSRVVDPSAINGTHGTLNPRTERNAKNYAERSTSALQWLYRAAMISRFFGHPPAPPKLKK